MPSVAVEQPLGLTLEIMQLRSFARAWTEAKRPKNDDDEELRGPMADWVNRVQMLRDQEAIEDMRRILGQV